MKSSISSHEIGIPSLSLASYPAVNYEGIPSLSLASYPAVDYEGIPSLSLASYPAVDYAWGYTLPLPSLVPCCELWGYTLPLPSIIPSCELWGYTLPLPSLVPSYELWGYTLPLPSLVPSCELWGYTLPLPSLVPSCEGIPSLSRASYPAVNYEGISTATVDQPMQIFLYLIHRVREFMAFTSEVLVERTAVGQRLTVKEQGMLHTYYGHTFSVHSSTASLWDSGCGQSITFDQKFRNACGC